MIPSRKPPNSNEAAAAAIEVLAADNTVRAPVSASPA